MAARTTITVMNPLRIGSHSASVKAGAEKYGQGQGT